MEELEQYYYGAQGDMLLKADAPLLTSTTGAWQTIYGKKVWVSLNQEANIFNCLPRIPWEHSGWRMITTRGVTSGTGIPEGNALPDTAKPTFTTVSEYPKTIVHGFDVSEVEDVLSDKDDTIGNPWETMLEYTGKEHIEMINQNLGRSVSEGSAGWSKQSSTANRENLHPIDQIVASYAESVACGWGNSGATADCYNFLRSGSSDYKDSYISHNSNTDRDLTLNIIDTCFNNIWNRGGNPKVIITGYDTLMRIQQLLQSQQRFQEAAKVIPTFNGIQGVEGVEAGFMVATYHGVPIIPSHNVTTDTVSRVFILDTDYLKMRVAKPTELFISKDPLIVDAFKGQGYYRTMLESMCTNFWVQGKIRDLK